MLWIAYIPAPIWRKRSHRRSLRRGVMASTHEHRYAVSVTWTGNLGSGTSGYRDYSCDYEIGAEAKPIILGSSDPAFRGDRSRWNPEELLVASDRKSTRLNSSHVRLSYALF